MDKKIDVKIQRKNMDPLGRQICLNNYITFEQMKAFMLRTLIPKPFLDDKLIYIYVIGDKKYLLENQEDYEEIKKLNETLVGYLDVRYITIYEQFENRKQGNQNQQINQQKENIEEQNLKNQQLSQNQEEEISKEDLRQIYSTLCKQFFSKNKNLTCPCSRGNKLENCYFCNNQKQIQYESYQQELDQALENFLLDNLQKLELYIKDKLQYNKLGMNGSKTFHNELMNFENLKSFNFLCIKCKQGFPRQSNVYVKQQKFPQSSVCISCYQNLIKEEQQQYICLGKDQMSQPHNMQRIN